MFIKLDEKVIALLCCPLCKSELVKTESSFQCNDCGINFPCMEIDTGSAKEKVFDFRIHRPTYCVPEGLRQWADTQIEYENFHIKSAQKDHIQTYLDEIDSVAEIYNEVFHLEGKILDVGGHQGKLRHFIKETEAYVSIDPLVHTFEGIRRQSNLLGAYPCLSTPCNFVLAHSEHLPFKSKSFDWIHMRSVVDHFADPVLAFVEAYRCCKPDGKLLVGLSISGENGAHAPKAEISLLDRLMNKIKREGFASLIEAIIKKKILRHDDHIFRLTYAQLIGLFEATHWEIVKEHWQKPPFSNCIYVSAQPGPIGSRGS